MNFTLKRTLEQKMVWEKDGKEKFIEVSKPKTKRGNKMSRYIFLALGLLVFLPGLLFAQKKGSTKVIQKSSPGVQTSVIQTTLKGEVVASDTLNLPDTVYAGMPFTGSMKVAEATKVGWVEVEGKKYPAKTGLLQVAGVMTTAGALAVGLLDDDGKKIGTCNVTVIKRPDTRPNDYPEIFQTGTQADIRDEGIDGMGGNTLAQIGKDILPIVTEIPGRSILSIPHDLKTGKQPFRFKDVASDVNRSVTVVRADIEGPEVMQANKAAQFMLMVLGLEEWDFEEKPLEVDIRTEGSITVGEEGQMSYSIDVVNADGVAEVPFTCHSGPTAGPYDIIATIALAGRFDDEPCCVLLGIEFKIAGDEGEGEEIKDFAKKLKKELEKEGGKSAKAIGAAGDRIIKGYKVILALTRPWEIYATIGKGVCKGAECQVSEKVECRLIPRNERGDTKEGMPGGVNYSENEAWPPPSDKDWWKGKGAGALARAIANVLTYCECDDGSKKWPPADAEPVPECKKEE